MKKGITIRFSQERFKQISDYAKMCEESIASLIRRAIRNMLSENGVQDENGERIVQYTNNEIKNKKAKK